MMRFQSLISTRHWLACGIAASALLSACGQEAASDTPTASTGDTTLSAYQALAASLQACSDKQAACETDAAGDAAKLAECDAAAKSCQDKTKAASDNARNHLAKDAQDCARSHRGHDDDAGVDEGCHHCIEQHAPSSPSCLPELFKCLDKTGILESNPSTDLDQATRDAIVACVQSAHTCIVNDMSTHGGPGRGDNGGPGGPGVPHDHAGAPAFPGGHAGAPTFPGGRAGAPAIPPREHAGSGPFGVGGAPGHRGQDEGGSGDEDEAGRGGRLPGFPGAGGGEPRGPREPRGARGGEGGAEAAGAGGS